MKVLSVFKILFQIVRTSSEKLVLQALLLDGAANAPGKAKCKNADKQLWSHYCFKSSGQG